MFLKTSEKVPGCIARIKKCKLEKISRARNDEILEKYPRKVRDEFFNNFVFTKMKIVVEF